MYPHAEPPGPVDAGGRAEPAWAAGDGPDVDINFNAFYDVERPAAYLPNNSRALRARNGTQEVPSVQLKPLTSTSAALKAEVVRLIPTAPTDSDLRRYGLANAGRDETCIPVIRAGYAISPAVRGLDRVGSGIEASREQGWPYGGAPVVHASPEPPDDVRPHRSLTLLRRSWYQNECENREFIRASRSPSRSWRWFSRQVSG